MEKFSINKYDINGKHSLLNDDNTLMLFNSVEEAVDFLKSKGFSDEDIDEVSIEEATEEEIKDTYVSDKEVGV
jgi:hypothetical protein